MKCVHTFDLSEAPLLRNEELRSFFERRSAAGDRLLAFFAERAAGERFFLHAITGGSDSYRFHHACTESSPRAFPTFTDVCPGVHWFEREIYDLFGIRPEGHPEINPLRFHESWPKGFYPLRGEAVPSPGPRRGYRFLQVRGEGIHEIAVGPVHAGIIEPGHFRFSCAGETIQNLEIRLGYQHKGTESLFPGTPGMRQILLSESISGDTAVGHSNACARLLERILGRPADPRAERWRSVALEIERIANHCGDLGGLSADIGYLFGTAHFARLRGTALNLLMRLTGSRFGRGLNRVGGSGPRVPGIEAEELLDGLAALQTEVERIGATMLESPSVVSRMDGTGRLLLHTAKTLQIVGVAGRASGRDVDARRDFPPPVFEAHPPDVVVAAEGDALARARIRYKEMLASFRWLQEVLRTADSQSPPGDRQPASESCRRTLTVSVEEGWRGEIVHAAIMEGTEGRISRYKVVDPSFHNWPGLSFAVQKNVVSDFPLCNKSFNLSYSGADL